ncbi:MAG: ribokinase, partial [Candidatus Eremiobacteraeota bacterium]|nr:ribokinase [Candidatus Eremiobacteraeota bacterium]
GTALITVDKVGSNTIVVVPGANDKCDVAQVDRALASFSEPGILLVQHELSVRTVEHAIRVAKRAGWYVVLDPAPARSMSEGILELVDVVTPNESEAESISGIPLRRREDATAAAQALVARGVRLAVVTLGAEGAVWSDGANTGWIPSIAADAVDTTAAGDAYTAGLAVALAEGRPIVEALRFAGAAGAFSVTRVGAQPSLGRRAEVDALL